MTDNNTIESNHANLRHLVELVENPNPTIASLALVELHRKTGPRNQSDDQPMPYQIRVLPAWWYEEGFTPKSRTAHAARAVAKLMGQDAYPVRELCIHFDGFEVTVHAKYETQPVVEIQDVIEKLING